MLSVLPGLVKADAGAVRVFGRDCGARALRRVRVAKLHA